MDDKKPAPAQTIAEPTPAASPAAASKGPVPQQIFIVGAPRSGTSATMKAVQKALPDHASFTEGHFIDILPHLTSAIRFFFDEGKAVYRNYKDFAIAASDQTEVRNVVVDAVTRYYSGLVGERFIDKTHGPAMIYALRDLKRVYPHGKVILLQRRALEYMRSVMLKFTRDDWDQNLSRWVACVRARREVEAELGDYMIALDQYELAHQPGRSATRIANHLNLGPAGRQSVLDSLNGPKVEKTKGTDYTAMDLSELELDPATERRFRETTRQIFEWMDYSYDKAYWRKQDPAADG
jgi:hypothetical protein